VRNFEGSTLETNPPPVVATVGYGLFPASSFLP